MINNKNLQVVAEREKQQKFTFIQKVNFFYIINATNEDEASEKFNNIGLHPSEYYRFASESQIIDTEVIGNEDFEESDSESRCIIKDVNSFRKSKGY
jgi:hypothetical protein